MADIQELMDACITVITEYHEKRKHVVPEEPTATIPTDPSLALPQPSIIEQLPRLIAEATSTDTTRRPLLEYVLHSVHLLQAIKAREELSEAEDTATIQHLTQFILDIQSLLQTSQNTQVTVHYNETTTSVYGLMNGIISYSLCVSGEILQETLLPAFGVTPRSERSKIESTLTRAIANHYEQQKQQKTFAELTLSAEQVARERDTLREEKEALRTKVSQLTTTLSEATLSAEQVAKERDAFREETEALRTKVSQLKTTLSEATLSEEQAAKERDTLREEKEALRTKVSQLTTTLSEATLSEEQAAKERDAFREETEALRTKVSQLKTTLSEATLSAEQAATEISGLRNTQDRVAKDLARTKAELATTKEQVTRLTPEFPTPKQQSFIGRPPPAPSPAPSLPLPRPSLKQNYSSSAPPGTTMFSPRGGHRSSAKPPTGASSETTPRTPRPPAGLG